MIVDTIFRVVQLKFERIISMRNYRAMASEGEKVISMAKQLVLNSFSLRGLMREMN